jgi:hypothetical protein
MCGTLGDLPFGRYQLRGWHPFEGTRARRVVVAKTKTVHLTPLLFGATSAYRTKAPQK